MPLVSIRLPDEIERSLSREAQRTQRPKSEIVREAIVDYLKQRERDCYAVTEQVRTVDRTRIGDGPLAVLASDEIEALERSVMGVMGIQFP